ncbi:MAG: M48 family metalloprotease, partial [Anaerolineales bacterium]|nr:M48 family metalloprotease [Anaerolineales bacterium]
AVNPVTGKRQIMLMSETQEVQLGAQYDPEVMTTFGEYKSDKLLSFIRENGDRMGKESHRPNLQYHFRILDSPVINAFAVPGGYIYLTRGILAQLNNEAELIGILGHEMGHVTARHSASQQSQQQLSQLALMGGMIASERFARYAQFTMQGMGLLRLKFSRDNEREADRLGVEYSSRIGFDAHKMADFFMVLNKMNMASSYGGVPTFLSTHPDPGDRYNTVHQKAAQWQETLGNSEWKVNADNYLKMIDGIIYGEDPKQGYVEGNIFYHPKLRFRFAFPPDWKLQNSPMQVAMAPTNGRAMIVFAISQQKDLKAAAQETISKMGLTYQGGRNTTVNGMRALTTFSKQYPQYQASSQQQPISVLSYYISCKGLIYAFHGVSQEADYNYYRNALESTMKSFNTLTDSARINVKPKRIIVKSVRKAGKLSDVFISLGVARDKMAQTALLNNLELSDKVRAGKLIKVVGE